MTDIEEDVDDSLGSDEFIVQEEKHLLDALVDRLSTAIGLFFGILHSNHTGLRSVYQHIH